MVGVFECFFDMFVFLEVVEVLDTLCEGGF